MVKNKAIVIGVLLVFLSANVWAQVGENRFIVYFSDKDNTPHTIDNPETYLSGRSIARRQNQNIAIDEKDLPVDPAYIQLVSELGNVEILHEIKWFNAILIETTDPNVIQGIQNLDEVIRLEVSPTIGTGGEEIVTNRVRHSEAKQDEDYGPSLNQIEMLNGLGLHEDGFKGEGIWIAVMDGGYLDMTNSAVLDSFFDEDRMLGRRNFVDDNEQTFIRSNHGTYVMSTMAGNLVDSLIGTAPEASYLLCITEDVFSERRIEEALWAVGAAYADSVGVDIINTSLGYTTFDVVTENYTYADLDGNTALITRASDIAASRGMLMITSAGNSGNNEWYYIGTPADGDSVLSIGAVNGLSEVTAFSSRGPSFDGRVKPNVMAQGGQSVITDLGSGIRTGNGTSFAAPILTGMAACLWQAYPNATAWEVHQAIEQSAHLYSMPNDSMGYGIPDFELARGLLNFTVGVNDINGESSSLKVFPNPIDGITFNVVLPENTAKRVEAKLYDLSGRMVYSAQYQSDGLSLLSFELNQKLEAGIYILAIFDADNQTLGTAKIVSP